MDGLATFLRTFRPRRSYILGETQFRMKRMPGERQPRFLKLFLALGAALALFVAIPSVTPIPGIDSGIFLYGAQTILHGAVPYRDFWENKPPGIYFIDAVGLWLGGGSRWGIWALEWISLWLAACFGFQAIREAFGNIPALFAGASLLAAFARVFQGGNFTEEYALPLQPKKISWTE